MLVLDQGGHKINHFLADSSLMSMHYPEPPGLASAHNARARVRARAPGSNWTAFRRNVPYRGRHGGRHTEKWLGRQQKRGRKSGKVRRAAEAPRDRELMTLKLAQWSEREIAQELNIPKSVVHYVVARDQWVQLPFDVLDSVPPPPSWRSDSSANGVSGTSTCRA